MTAEIAVMNKIAVALAADSAATSRQGDNQKIFNSADKLFQLDGSSPVGIMIYGSAEYMGIPWETVIKLYRKFHKGPHDHLQAYGEDFLRFLRSPELVSDAAINAFFLNTVRQLLWQLKAQIQHRLTAILPNDPSTTFAEATDRHCSDLLININAAPRIENAPVDIANQLLTSHYATLDTEISNIFGAEDPGIPGRQKIKEVVCAISVIQPNKTEVDASGLVIAGFGEAELFPDIWNCHIKATLPMRLLQFSRQPWQPVTLENNASITPFAQDEMVHAFMTGVDPTLRATVSKSFDLLMQNLVTRLAGNLQGYTPQQVDQFKLQADAVRADLLNNLSQEVSTYSRDKHVVPVLAAVGVLPKDELTTMAETLVALTSFKRRMSSQAETVGGAIDVAVISKGDGFIWIKRKHYFDPTLNVRYIKNIQNHATP